MRVSRLLHRGPKRRSRIRNYGRRGGSKQKQQHHRTNATKPNNDFYCNTEGGQRQQRLVTTTATAALNRGFRRTGGGFAYAHALVIDETTAEVVCILRHTLEFCGWKFGLRKQRTTSGKELPPLLSLFRSCLADFTFLLIFSHQIHVLPICFLLLLIHSLLKARAIS